MRRLAIGVILLYGTVLIAQTTTPKLGWDYLDTNMTAVTDFQTKYDDGSWTSVGVPTDVTPFPGGKTYWVPLLNFIGQHTVQVRACNSVVCSEPSSPLVVTKPVAVANVRIVGGR